MPTTGTVRTLLVTLRGLAVEIAYGVNAGTAIRHGQPPPPPPRTSRDAAVAAYFEGREVRWRLVYESAITSATEPGGRLLAIFDALREAAIEPRLRNITFADTHLARGPDARRVVDLHFRLLRQRLVELAQATGTHDPHSLADSIERLSRAAAGMAEDAETVHAIAIAREAARDHLEAATG
jgi:hypothetical protein